MLSPTCCSPEAFEPGHLFRLREEACESPGQALDGETGAYTDLSAPPTTHPAQGPGPTGSRPCEADAAIHPGRELAMVPQARSGRAWMDAHLPRGIWVSPRKLRRPWAGSTLASCQPQPNTCLAGLFPDLGLKVNKSAIQFHLPKLQIKMELQDMHTHSSLDFP